MVPIPRFPLALLLPLILVIPHGAAKAATSLADAIKEADAKYLEAPDVEGADTAPKIEVSGGEEDEEAAPETQEISLDGVRAVLSYTKETSEDGGTTRASVVTVFADDKEITTLSPRKRASAALRRACKSPRSISAIHTRRWWSRSTPAVRIAVRTRV